MTGVIGDWVVLSDGTQGQVWSEAQADQSGQRVWIAIAGAPARCVRVEDLRAPVEQPELEI